MITRSTIVVSPSSLNLIQYCFTDYYNGLCFDSVLVGIIFVVIAAIAVDKGFVEFSCFRMETIFVVIGVGKQVLVVTVQQWCYIA